MTTPFSSFNFLTTGATTARTMPDRLSELVNAKDYGAYGDGAHDDTAALQAAINAAYGPSNNPHGGLSSGYLRNRPLFIPNGIYQISSPLLLTQIQGARIFGAGKFATRIVNTTTSGAMFYGDVFKTNGFAYSVIENMTLVAAPPTTGSFNCGFDMGWDGTGDVALHANTFRNVRFESGDYGCAIGVGGYMGSEILFVGCDFINCGTGLAGFNYNALDFTVIGGEFQGCGIGLDCRACSTFPYVSSVRFSGSKSFDIKFDSFNGMSVEACTSTSVVPFLRLLGGSPVKTKACTYTPSSSGQYGQSQSALIMDGCIVANSILMGPNDINPAGDVYMRGCTVPANFISSSFGSPRAKENI